MSVEEIERQLPNAYYSEYDKHRIRLPSDEVRQLQEMTSTRPLEPMYAPIMSMRTVILTRRWVHFPGQGKGAVWCDDENTIYGPICFAGQRTMPAPIERLTEPDGGW